MENDGNGVLFEGLTCRREWRNSRVKPLNGQSLQDSVALGRKKIFALEKVSIDDHQADLDSAILHPPTKCPLF
jgi:hypothetical protein